MYAVSAYGGVVCREAVHSSESRYAELAAELAHDKKDVSDFATHTHTHTHTHTCAMYFDNRQ